MTAQPVKLRSSLLQDMNLNKENLILNVPNDKLIGDVQQCDKVSIGHQHVHSSLLALPRAGPKAKYTFIFNKL